ncbi:MAG: hypothetical protein HYS12_03040 [Planctomycetes bacterium]|nr:hypothetical protein [Planctomycetota bacterium]
MPRPLRVTLSALWLASLLAMPLRAVGQEKGAKNTAPAAAEKAARAALASFDKSDPGWKARMEAWVRLMKAGPAAVPVLEEALKKESPAARAFAAQALAALRGPPAVREAVTDYDLAALDSARLGHVAPDFSLTDLSGKAYRLSRFRGKQAVVLTFFLYDG